MLIKFNMGWGTAIRSDCPKSRAQDRVPKVRPMQSEEEASVEGVLEVLDFRGF